MHHTYIATFSMHTACMYVCMYALLLILPMKKGVLDGHGGKQCAEFALDDLPSQIVSSLRSGSTYPDALYSSFLKTDKVLFIFQCLVDDT